jgi:sugar/nucleoside kinase (ribokinase family)
MADARSGLLAGGNFIVDYVKIVNHLPAENMLALISSESMANGGGPYNVLKDLAAMRAGFPLAAAGMVGDDANGAWIEQDCQSHGIDTAQLRRTPLAPTSYTDAMTVRSTGRRTFFHQAGANALLDAEHFDFTGTKARLFHMGYLMLLEKLDELVDGRTRATEVLERAQAAGLETSVDIVSTEHPRFREIACSALPFTDHLIINEVEAGKIVGKVLHTSDIGGLRAAAAEILEMGVNKAVVIHFEEGAVAAERGAPVTVRGSLELPPGYSRGATGAGDAFAAGYIYGVHEGWAVAQRLDLAVCAAAACLTDPTPSGGLVPVEDCLALGSKYAHRALS